MSDTEMDEFEDPGPTNVDVLNKYKQAGEMAARVLKEVVALCVPDATVLEICKKGDEKILAEVAPVYNKKVEGKLISKGIAFPTCISVNNVICHFSPLESDAPIKLAAGDIVKVDLGVHLDGFIAAVADTVVVGATKEAPVTGAKADVIAAAHTAAEIAARLIRPGAKTSDVTKAIQKIAADFKVTAIEGMLSHQIGRNSIDGEKAIISNPSDQQKKDHKDSEFAVNEVYAVDIFMSTGEGKAKPGNQRTTIYKKTDNVYLLKMKASRTFLSEISKKFTVMPFTLRSCEDENKARMGVKECVSHQVLQPFDVLYDSEGSFVAQAKFVVLVMPNGNTRLTPDNFDKDVVKSEAQVTDADLKKLLAASLSSKKKKKKTAGKKKEGEGADDKDDEDDAAEATTEKAATK